MSFLAWLLFAYAVVGCAWWLWLVVGAIRVARAVPVLARVEPPPPETWPRLSLVVAACNEADHLESAVSTLLRQDYPDLEVVLVDDRSTDDTGAIADRLATTDGRLHVLHVTHLPAGWLGKVHALARGAEAARGDWILFTHADVHFAPGTLRRAVAVVQRGSLGQPRIETLLLSPVAALVSLVLTVRSGWLGWCRGGVLWRGTLCPSALVRGGRRIRFL